MKAPIQINPTTGRGKHGERRNHILWFAAQVVAEAGIEGLTMPRIAKGLGISTAAVYKHFKSKNEILSILALRLVQLLDRLLTLATESAQKRPWYGMASMASAYAELHVRDVGSARLMDAFISNPRELLEEPLRGEVWNIMNRLWDQCEQFVRAIGVPDANAADAGWMSWTTLQGALITSGYVEERGAGKVEDIARQSVCWVIRGAGGPWDAAAEKEWKFGCDAGRAAAMQILEDK